MLPEIEVDLHSDTNSRPTPAMRQAMATAAVGNEQAGEDPTTNLLQAMVAELLGKEAAVFLPSGTLCNEIAYRVHTEPGDEVLLDRTAHTLHAESGAPAALSGVMTRPLDGRAGIFSAGQVRAAVRLPSHHAPRTRLLSVENTSNFGGGTVWPLDRVREVCAVAREHGMATHLDGARLLNAVIASGTPADAYAAPFDTCWIDLSKGLGCPVGAVLAGSAKLMSRAFRFKHMFGGAMRQSGILAAAGVHALEHHVERLAEDHENARHFATLAGALDGISVDINAVETNIVFLDVSATGLTSERISERLLERGVRISPHDPGMLRAVTHLDVDRAGVERAAAALAEAIS